LYFKRNVVNGGVASVLLRQVVDGYHENFWSNEVTAAPSSQLSYQQRHQC
jgi:hypothetical protein